MPTNSLHRFASRRLLLAATAAIFSFTGCSDRSSRHDSGAEQMNAEPAKPAMSAQDLFFNDNLLVEANLGRGFGGGRGPGGSSGPDGGHRGGSHGGHRGGGMSMGGGESAGGGFGGGRRGGSDFEPMDEASPGGPGAGNATMHDSSMPPIALRLRLTNNSKETVEVEFVLCKSELGDFAVRPIKLALAPGQSAEPEPMTSRLGLTSDELVLRVGLRLAGKVEQKDLVLKTVAAPEPSTVTKP